MSDTILQQNPALSTPQMGRLSPAFKQPIAANNACFNSLDCHSKKTKTHSPSYHISPCSPPIESLDMHNAAPNQMVVLDAFSAQCMAGHNGVLFIHGNDQNTLRLEVAKQLPSLLIDQVVYHPFRLGRTTLFVEGSIQVACLYHSHSD